MSEDERPGSDDVRIRDGIAPFPEAIPSLMPCGCGPGPGGQRALGCLRDHYEYPKAKA